MAGFEQAMAAVTQADTIVQGRIQDVRNQVAQAQNAALSTLGSLANTRLETTLQAPVAPTVSTDVDTSFDLPHISASSFGNVAFTPPEPPDLAVVPDLPDIVIPDFESSIASLSIPQAPGWAGPSAPPEAPVVGEVEVPAAPVITLPPVPVLTELEIPDFEGLTMPAFSAALPEFSGTAIPGILMWSEPTYSSEVLDEVVEQIRVLWSGGSGIPPAVEQAMVERATAREDVIVEREVNAVSEEFSRRGFTAPPGMAAARVDQIRQEGMVKKLGLNRELTIEFAKFQIENVRFAIQQGVAAENVFVNIFNNAAARLFEAAKFRVESQITIYNAQVALFNARMNGYQIQAQVFDTLVKAEVTKIEVFKAEVEAQIARGQLNEQQVKVYAARVDALRTQIEIFKAQMQGASVQSEVVRNRIEAYKGEVQAYAERVAAEKIRFDAYDSQVKAEVGKAGIIDAEARAFAALIQGKSAEADIGIKRAELVLQRNRTAVEAFAADISAERARVEAQLGVIDTRARAYVADTQRYAAVAQAQGAQASVRVAAKEAELRTNVAFYQAQIQAWVGSMEQQIRQASLVVESLKSAGQIASTLAAGAMASVHVGANINGGGSVSAAGSTAENTSTSNSRNYSENYNFSR